MEQIDIDPITDFVVIPVGTPQQEKPKGSAPRWLTRRTVYAFVFFMCILGGYEIYCVQRVYAFSAAAQAVAPSFCPEAVWTNATISSTIFGKVYLNPMVSNYDLAVDAATLCSQFENASKQAQSQIGISGGLDSNLSGNST